MRRDADQVPESIDHAPACVDHSALPIIAVAAAPRFMETPDSAIPHIGRVEVFIDDVTFQIDRPTDADRLLDDPTIRDANVADDYMPYWADIWPAARMMAKVVLREDWSKRLADGPVQVLELGCGLGVAGLAALHRGLDVIFTDYDITAIRFAERNAKLNGFTRFRTMPLDWRCPPDDLKVPVILAADLTYELRNIDPLLALIRKMLLPGGVCLLTDPDRTPAPFLRQRLDEMQFRYSTQFVRAGEPGGHRPKGTLYRLSVD